MSQPRLIKPLAAAARIIFAAAALACGGGDVTTPVAPGLVLTVISGDAQSAQAKAALASQIVIKVVDLAGNPVPYQVIQIVLPDGGSVGGAQFVQTGSDGTVHLNWVLGPSTGAQHIEAHAVDSRDGKTYSTTAPATATQIPVATVALDRTSTAVNVAWTTTLTATASDASGGVLTDRSATWQSSNPSVVTVANNGSFGGDVLGVAPGTATVTATMGGKSATATVTVTLAPVAHFDSRAGCAL